MLRFLTSGESHGPCLVAILEGMPAGVPINVTTLQREMRRRQLGYGRGPRMQFETDTVELLAGIVQTGKRDGAWFALPKEAAAWWKRRSHPSSPAASGRGSRMDSPPATAGNDI